EQFTGRKRGQQRHRPFRQGHDGAGTDGIVGHCRAEDAVRSAAEARVWPGEGETWLTLVNPWQRALRLSLTIRYDDIGGQKYTVTSLPGERWGLPLYDPALRGGVDAPGRSNAAVTAQRQA